MQARETLVKQGKLVSLFLVCPWAVYCVSFSWGKELRDGDGCNVPEAQGDEGGCIFPASQVRAFWNMDMACSSVLTGGGNPKLASDESRSLKHPPC